MLPKLGVQWPCASLNNRAGMQHNDGGNPRKEKGSVFTADGRWEKHQESTSVIHKGRAADFNTAPCRSRSGVRLRWKKDERVVHGGLISSEEFRRRN